MPRPCKICTSGKSDEIEQALAQGDSLRNIGRRYGISATSVYRHSQHMVHTLRTHPRAPGLGSGVGFFGTPILENTSESPFLTEITRLIEQARRVTERAFDKKQDYIALMGISKQRELAELLAKVSIFVEKQYSKPVAPTFHEVHYIGPLCEHPEFQALRAATIRAANGSGEAIKQVFDQFTDKPAVLPVEDTIEHEVRT